MTAIDMILNPTWGSTDPNRSDLEEFSKLVDDTNRQDFENIGPFRTDQCVDVRKLILSIIVNTCLILFRTGYNWSKNRLLCLQIKRTFVDKNDGSRFDWGKIFLISTCKQTEK